MLSPRPVPGDLFRRRATVESLEDAALLGRGYARSAVRHLHRQRALGTIEGDVDGRLRGRIFQRVVDQLAQREPHQTPVEAGCISRPSLSLTVTARSAISGIIDAIVSRISSLSDDVLGLDGDMVHVEPGHFDRVVDQIAQ